MKYFFLLSFILSCHGITAQVPSDTLSLNEFKTKFPTPSLFDTWTAPTGIGGTFKITGTMLIPLDIGILAEKDPHMQQKVKRGGKRAFILRVVYDSAKAKGRIVLG